VEKDNKDNYELGAVSFVRILQVKEGNKPCYRTGKISCSYASKCCWARNCQGFPKAVFIFRVEAV